MATTTHRRCDDGVLVVVGRNSANSGFLRQVHHLPRGNASGFNRLVLVGVLNTVISVYYYLRPVMSMYKPDEAAQNMGSGDILVESTGGGVASLRSVAQPLSLGIVLAIVLCAIAVIGMVVLQAAVFPLAQDAAGLSSSVPVTQSAVSLPCSR
jgi:NADH:ubiquinone oxidoreductase subunit 2 (subunit N)